MNKHLDKGVETLSVGATEKIIVAVTHKQAAAIIDYIAELEARIDNAKTIIENEMGEWLPINNLYSPDHYLQLRQAIDVLDGRGE